MATCQPEVASRVVIVVLFAIVDAATLHWISKSSLPLNVRAPLPLSFCSLSCLLLTKFCLRSCHLHYSAAKAFQAAMLLFVLCLYVCVCARELRCSGININCLTEKIRDLFLGIFCCCLRLICLFVYTRLLFSCCLFWARATNVVWPRACACAYDSVYVHVFVCGT